MKIILRQNLDNLGKIGELVTVKNGYARNFLIPRGYAYYASEKAIKALEVEKKKYAKKIAKEKAGAEIIAAKLADLQISIPMKVGDEGKLYGSVTTQMIAQELSIRGFEIDKRNVIIDEAIRNLGVFDIKVKLHSEVITPLKIWVISEE
jgi:large subunit ribosomal protein L9